MHSGRAVKHPRIEAALAGGIAGLAGGLFGVGGGLVLVPILTGRFKLTQHQAHGTSLAIIGATALISVVVYALNGNVAWLTAAPVGVASGFAARWGARLAARTSAEVLAKVFAVFLLAVAIRLLWKTPAAAGHPFTGGVAVAVDLAVGVAVGLLAGYMGVGGGLIAVPAFTLLLGMTQQSAQGTSLAVILITAPAGGLEHHRLGNVVTRIVPASAIGAAVVGPLASLLVQRLPHALLVRAFAVFVVLNAASIWLRAERRKRQSARP